eukprot:TRINITY_DN872_c0_g1_i5.p1 TRINITY_DN872_c0_g1~~TRINITY_DN872_c0_g1_i5.p1  ORF type:complete len:172 (+),score=63.06 TRINITY_DN872_c0_g1_i5:65-580(+)
MSTGPGCSKVAKFAVKKHTTPLHLAAAAGNLELVKHLISKCDCEVANAVGKKPIDVSSTAEVTEFLKQKMVAQPTAAVTTAAPVHVDVASTTAAPVADTTPEAATTEPVADATPEAATTEPVADTTPEAATTEPVADATPEAATTEPVADATPEAATTEPVAVESVATIAG